MVAVIAAVAAAHVATTARPVVAPHVAVSEPVVSHPLAIPQVHDDVAVTPRAAINPVMAPRTYTETASDQPGAPQTPPLEPSAMVFLSLILLAGFVGGCAVDAMANDSTTRRTRIAAGCIGALIALLVVCVAALIATRFR